MFLAGSFWYIPCFTNERGRLPFDSYAARLPAGQRSASFKTSVAFIWRIASRSECICSSGDHDNACGGERAQPPINDEPNYLSVLEICLDDGIDEMIVF